MTVTETLTREFSALGTYVYLATPDRVEEAEAVARELLAAVDRACSRFRSDSDLSAANGRPGRWTAVGPLLLDAVEVALDAAVATDGLVDPCLGRQLVELGYDRDFTLLRARASAGPAPAASPDAWRDLQLDRAAGALKVPAGVAVDLGATAKAWASDLIAESVHEETGQPVLVSLGGDIRICGPAEPDGWPVLITETPGGRCESVAEELVWLDGGGLATSSTRVRRWRAGRTEYHHLIDPRTGSPVAETWRTVSTTGPTCVAANVASTAALVLGDHAPDWLEEHQVDARLVAADGALRYVGQWPAPQESR